MRVVLCVRWIYFPTENLPRPQNVYFIPYNLSKKISEKKKRKDTATAEIIIFTQ